MVGDHQAGPLYIGRRQRADIEPTPEIRRKQRLEETVSAQVAPAHLINVGHHFS